MDVCIVPAAFGMITQQQQQQAQIASIAPGQSDEVENAVANISAHLHKTTPVPGVATTLPAGLSPTVRSRLSFGV